MTCMTIEARRIQELVRIVDDMVLSKTEATLIVETVTNDLKSALQCLTEPYNVVPFGSFINGLVCHGSDLDFYLGKLEDLLYKRFCQCFRYFIFFAVFRNSREMPNIRRNSVIVENSYSRIA